MTDSSEKTASAGVKRGLMRGLDKAGKALIAPILDEMAENNVIPDSIEASALLQAARLADRQTVLALYVERDGEIIETPTGQLKAHPAIVESRQCAVAITRILSSVSLVDTSGVARKSARHVRAGNASARAAARRRGEDG